MPENSFDCTTCGACCFGGNSRYVALLSEDRMRAIPEAAIAVIGDRRFMAMCGNRCAQLRLDPLHRTLCAIYDQRPEACRAFRAGSFECRAARARRGDDAALFRQGSMPVQALPEHVHAGIAGLPQVPGPGAVL